MIIVHPLNNICSPVLRQYWHHKFDFNITKLYNVSSSKALLLDINDLYTSYKNVTWWFQAIIFRNQSFMIKPSFLSCRHPLPCQRISVALIIAFYGIEHLSFMLQLLPREKKSHEYNDALKSRYKHLPEVKRILRYEGIQTLWLFDRPRVSSKGRDDI